MRRWVVIALIGLAGLAVALAASLAFVGTQLDDAKIGRQDLEFEVEDLRQELNSVSEERSDLAQRVEEQRKTNQQLSQEIERARGATQPAVPAAAPAAASSTDTQAAP